MDITTLMMQMLKLFMIIFLGYIIYKCKLVDDNFTAKFSKLILNVTMPAMILASVLNLEERQPIRDVLTAFAVAMTLFFIILPIVGLILAKILRVGKNREGLYIFMSSFSNVGFMGFPIINALCGGTGLFYAAIFNLAFNLSIFSLGVCLVNKDKGQKTKFDPKLLFTPGIILSSMAIIIYFLNIKFPAIICETVDSIGSITSPSAMIIIGCSLAKMDVKSIFSDWRLYPWTLIKQIAIPLLLWVPLNMIIKNELLLTVSYILSAMPVANTAVMFATVYDGDVELAARSVFLTTLLSLITVPLCIMTVM